MAATKSREDFNPQLGIISTHVTPNRTKIVQRFRKKENIKVNKNLIRLKANKEKEKIRLSQEVVLLRENIPAQVSSYTLVLDHEEIFGLIEDGRKNEYERIDREIQPFITAFCETEFEIIYQEALKNRDCLVERGDVEKRINADYEQEVKGIHSLYKELYPILFEKYIDKGFNDGFNNLERRLRVLTNNHKPSIFSQFKQWMVNSRGDVITLFVIIGLIITVYSILNWIIALPMLERFDFFNNNLWIVFLVSFLIFIIVVLAILFVNSVRAYCEENRIIEKNKV